jgi:hypothetical protein
LELRRLCRRQRHAGSVTKPLELEPVRTIAFWATTFVVVFELIAGSVWNLLQIEWVRVQLSHLRYPDYFAYISGARQVGGAAVIIAPRFPGSRNGRTYPALSLGPFRSGSSFFCMPFRS